MLIKCAVIEDGPGPSEVVISVTMVGGEQEEVVVSKRLLHQGGIEVGSALLFREKAYLIELPRESEKGHWRIWVPESEVIRAPDLHMA